ncbi:SDR family NAD(P)-dependent oxidoreductase [Paenibacillus sp. MWE-103]|uniref:SDR family NAD(P)-dependent oxidoreductase n=1 Tax=Paenibacillus artemisiicola TaxID=1172618 RepID=A0ABS3WK94_9BACL|nr:oxidoreductase [Paenibacillus artemisiicola]MBO7748555.1 SDR family NAD(P)-dependent oxidoreductase [Paenibacillus artemisiicola]
MQPTDNYVPTPQAPIPSGFGPQTTAAEALGGRDLTGKTAIVTGGYSGLGLETARVLAEAGATVVVPARTPEKAAAAVAGLPRVELETLDLADPASIDAFAARFLASGRPLDILVNSAGIMATPLTRDARGYESQFAVNHLGHFQLAARLWPALKQSGDARVVSVSSRALRFAGVDLEDPNYEHREYDKWMAYGQSKSANALFAVELDRIGFAHGVRAFSVHPGTIVTDLSRHLSDDEMRGMGALDEHGNRVASDPRFKTVAQGAATSVWCAANPQLEGRGGVYCEDADIAVVAEPGSDAFSAGVAQWAIDPEAARKLWTLSEKLTGVTFR